MCGFIGCLHKPEHAIAKDTFEDMTNIITHRGPNDDGYYIDDAIQLGFRRLSIIDVEGGHQPLSIETERYWIIFNGEIYNYVELREDLIKAGYQFATHSDTEVIINLYHQKGPEAVKELRGMFGFVIWDKQEQVLFGARDHFGIKPFYYTEAHGKFIFGSERKSLLLAIEKDEFNAQALQHYLTYQYVPEPYTLTKGIYKLEPGHYFTKRPDAPMQVTQYWHPHFKPVAKQDPNMIQEIREVLYDSVKVHMRSDVPVGSFLSGGIDSTAIVAIAKEYHPNIQTFSVGFERNGFSEIDVAKESAEKLGVENISYLVTPEEFMQELPKIMWHMDDPLADPAAIPLYFVAREASKHVTVVLSGEGSDELFGGYNIYREPQSLKLFNYVPDALKYGLRQLAHTLPEGVKGRSFIIRGCSSIEERYVGNAKMFLEKEKQELLKQYSSGQTYQEITAPLYERVKAYDDINKMQYVDIHTWLRGDILLKADKMTMAHSLELRVPFLDKEVFRVAAQLQTAQKTAQNTTKYLLREAMKGIVPDHVLMRRKLGFPVPIRHWLKDEMYGWAQALIQTSETEQLLNKGYVLQLLEAHRTGKGDYSRKIWTVLMFMLWHQIYVEKKYSFGHAQLKLEKQPQS